MSTIVNKVKDAVSGNKGNAGTSGSGVAVPDQYSGYAAHDEAAGKANDLKPWSYTPKKWSEDDIDIKIDYCSICGSDLHTSHNGWPAPTQFPAIVGHEIVGHVVKAGSNTTHKVGDRVGVGAQSGSCMECDICKSGRENYCPDMVGTYQGKWEDGSISQGGYADFVRVKGHFALAIPEQIKSEEAAPLMCAGVTTYSPLKRFGAGPGKKVAIVGIGGLGHLGLQWSNALGAETYAISHSDRKKDDAEELGVKPENFIIASDPEETAKKWGATFDIIICTSFQADLPIEKLYFPLLKPEGALVLNGLPEEKLPAMFGQAFAGKGVALAGSMIGSPGELKDMLQLAVQKNVRPWIQKRPMKEAASAVQAMDDGKARYRIVLENTGA